MKSETNPDKASVKTTNLISVIVPVYKVEPYLDRCVQSVVDQTYKNIEIILVDDGSPDNCPAMCESWARRDSRIKVVHKTNGGLSDARNAGTSVASGEYISFVDSDDWIHHQFLELLLSALANTGAELAACDIKKTALLKEIDSPEQKPPLCIYTSEEAMNYLAHGERIRAVAWNKLYKKELLQNETFPVGKLHEDEFFTYRIIDKCSKLVYVDLPLYYYYQRSGSLMSECSVRHIDALEAYCERQAFFREKYPSLYLQDKLMICETCVNLYNSLSKEKTSEIEEANKRICNYRNLVHFSAKELFRCSLRQLTYIIGSMPSFINLFSKIRTFKQKGKQ